jgi:hypothetical protein
MAGKTNAWAADLLGLFFQAAAVANIASNATSGPQTNLYISLHTADPGVTGSQTTNEAAYPSYARVAVARTSGGWVLTGTSISPASPIVFPGATGGSEIETFFGIGSASAGAGTLYYSGAMIPALAVSDGVVPELTSATMVVES